MSRMAGVRLVIANPTVRPYPFSIPYPMAGAPEDMKGIPWNISHIQADKVWDLGVKGAGVTVAGLDTGAEWDHPALQEAYRGWEGSKAEHTYNWHDAWGDSPTQPVDDDGHGTHTLGIVLGDGGSGRQIGVAPGAKWIACRNMRRGVGNPGSYLECMEWLLAPYPPGGDPFMDGRPELAPDVVNNSWGCPTSEGCQQDVLRPALEALKAAGIMMVVSAGNDGPACETVADEPAIYASVFTVGATDAEDRITGFSSRGPAGGKDVKPDIVAPGDEIASAWKEGGYAAASGTSMSGPHIAGVIALVWSANPSLKGQIGRTNDLLRQTAQPKEVAESCNGEEPAGIFGIIANPVCACGGASGAVNNVYGWGMVDALKAVQQAIKEMP